jgi:hypothetical protein
MSLPRATFSTSRGALAPAASNQDSSSRRQQMGRASLHGSTEDEEFYNECTSALFEGVNPSSLDWCQ